MQQPDINIKTIINKLIEEQKRIELKIDNLLNRNIKK